MKEDEEVQLYTEENNKLNEKKSCKEIFREIASRHWFTVGMISVITLAYFFPDIGTHRIIKKVFSKIAVALIFFFGGINLKFSELKKGLPRWGMHISMQAFTFIYFPAVAFGCVKLANIILKNNPNYEPILAGVIILACVPCSSSSAIVWTKSAGGNWIVAAFNSVVANLAGMGITPLLFILLLSENPTTDPLATFLDISYVLIIPMFVGKVLSIVLEKKWLSCYKRVQNVKWGEIEKILLLFIIWSSFCDTFIKFQKEGLTIVAILILTAFLAGLYVFMFVSSYLLSFIKFIVHDRTDTLALLFTNTSKTLSLGIPLILILYDGDPDIGLYQIPLLIYQPLQLTVSGIFLNILKNWKDRDPRLQEQNILLDTENSNLLASDKDS